MENIEINTNKGETYDTKKLFESIKIENKGNIYELNMETKENKISLFIVDKNRLPSINYNRTMSLEQLKDIVKASCEILSFNDFYAYLVALSYDNKINIIKNIDKLIIILKDGQQLIEIEMFPIKKNLDINMREVWNELSDIKEKIKEIDILKNEIKELKKELDNLRIRDEEKENEINILKNENEVLREIIEDKNKGNIIKEKFNENNNFIHKPYYGSSVIMTDYEKRLLFEAIEKKMNKKIDGMVKLYQATKDGGDPEIFHNRCDDIPNTLVLVESEGHRRFGGFTPIPWKSSKGLMVKDLQKKTFLFSLDKQKIYNLEMINSAVYHDRYSGPCFGEGFDIGIIGDPIKLNNLCTYQSSYNYQGDENALSEFKSGNNRNIKADEYEVFQIIFIG